MDAKKLAESNRLVKMYAGSIAYGTNLPTSDVDFRGIFAANPINLLTPFFPVKEYEDTSEEDTKFYELNHFIKLCTDCNPNVVELLWTVDSDITFRTPAYDHLRSNRMLMLSSKIAFTTSGYALAQLKRIKSHNKWINAPQPKEPPRQTDFVKLIHNLTETKMFKLNITEFRDGYRLIPYGENIFGLYRADGYQTFTADFTLNTTYDAVEDKDFFTSTPTWQQLLASILSLKPPKLRRKPIAIVKFCKEEYLRAKDMHKNYWAWRIPKDNKARLFYRLENEIARRAAKS